MSQVVRAQNPAMICLRRTSSGTKCKCQQCENPQAGLIQALPLLRSSGVWVQHYPRVASMMLAVVERPQSALYQSGSPPLNCHESVALRKRLPGSSSPTRCRTKLSPRRRSRHRLAPLYRRLRLPEGRLELMTGIRQRRLWPPGTLPSQKSARDGRKGARRRRDGPRHVGALVHGSVCRDFLEPATACGVHHRLGLPPACVVYDVSNACLGLLNGMMQVADMIELGQIRAGVVVGTESSRAPGRNDHPPAERRHVALPRRHQAGHGLADHRFRQRGGAAGRPAPEPHAATGCWAAWPGPNAGSAGSARAAASPPGRRPATPAADVHRFRGAAPRGRGRRPRPLPSSAEASAGSAAQVQTDLLPPGGPRPSQAAAGDARARPGRDFTTLRVSGQHRLGGPADHRGPGHRDGRVRPATAWPCWGSARGSTWSCWGWIGGHRPATSRAIASHSRAVGFIPTDFYPGEYAPIHRRDKPGGSLQFATAR